MEKLNAVYSERNTKQVVRNPMLKGNTLLGRFSVLTISLAVEPKGSSLLSETILSQFDPVSILRI
jgi:hypothetical protein